MGDHGITMLHCNYPDCQHDWWPRSELLPKVCPKCKRYNWNSVWEVEHEIGKSKQVRTKKGRLK